MSIVNDVQRAMDWLRESVCPLVELKLPPEEWPDADTAEYEYRTVNPSVHGMYWPSGRQMCGPAELFPHPGILVQVTDGEDSPAERKASMSLRLHLSAWNPGLHGRDTWEPDPSTGAYVRREADAFKPLYDECWRDAWNFLDVVVREVRNAESMGGLSIDRTQPVRFGPYSEQESIPDLYPFWFSWVDVPVWSGTAAPTYLQDYL